MIGWWRVQWLAGGFAAAVLAAAEGQPPSARAEDILPAGRPSDAAPARPRLEKDPLFERDDPYAVPARRMTARSEDAETGTADTPSPDDPASASDPPSRASLPEDGDTTAGEEPASPRDGEIDDSAFPQDGADPTIDTRPPEDVAVFETPPAGYDPLLFQIEDIDPLLTDRRSERLFRLEPYDPVGIRIGSFVLFPEAEITGISTNNVQGAPDGKADTGLGVKSSLRLVSDWTRHAIELRGTAYESYFDDYSTEDDREWSAEARGRLDVTRRTNLQGLVSRDFGQEARSAIDGVTTGPRPDVTTDIAAGSFNHRFNRLTVQLRGAVTDTAYSEKSAAKDSLDYRNSTVTEEAVRLSYELKPTLAVFAETALNQRDYHGVSPEDGLTRTSKGERYRLGLDLGGTSRIWRGEASIGYGTQRSKADALGDAGAFLLDANLTWRPSEITALLFTAKTDIATTTTQNSPGVIVRQAGLEVRHAFRRYLVATAGLTYTDYDYTHTALAESDLEMSAGAEYYASPEIVLFARYGHVDFDSSMSGASYTEDEIRLGARLRR